MATLAYRKMTREELDPCALLAAEAFYDYEYFSIYIPDAARRKRCLDAMIKCEFRANWDDPEVTFFVAAEDGRPVAVAQLCTPNFKKPSDAAYIRAGWLGVMRKGGIRQVNAWNDMEKIASAPCHALGGRNWYLSLLTVAKSDEGKGIGSRFLNECLIPHVKNAGGETFSLFTNSESNRRFYEKNGFVLFDEKRFDYGGKSIGSWSYAMKL
jgi:GNAT superfamily N-acetyltransferase